MKMLSRTLRFGQRLSSWWMIAMPRAAASTLSLSTTGSPSRTICPDDGRLDSAEDLHQRGLACAVLAEQHGDRSAADIEVDALERVGAAVGLADADARA